MQETIKWRINWDKDPKEQEQRAAKGQQRAGPGNGEEWNIVSAFGPPEYKPNNTNREIDIMIAEVVDFAYHSCNNRFGKTIPNKGSMPKIRTTFIVLMTCVNSCCSK